MEPVRRCIADNIKKSRLEKDLSVEDIGNAIGKSGKTVSAWEVGRGQPDADTMIRLCRLFDVDIADFYGESGDLAPISNDERDLVDTYRDLTSPHKHVLLAVARELRAAQGKE